MRVIIDLIDDIRNEIANRSDFTLSAMLLKQNPQNSNELIYVGESPIDSFEYSILNKQLLFRVGDKRILSVGELLKEIMILDMSSMMHEVRLYVNCMYPDMEIVGFAKSIEQKQYILIIKI